MSLCKDLNRPPCSIICWARKSSNSGWVGGSPKRPKSLALATSPRPKWCCQSRLTITRQASGFEGSVIHRANAKRRPVDSPCA